MKKKKWSAVAAVAVVAVAAWLILKPSSKPKVSLETAYVSRVDISNSITATGTVEPVTEVEVGTQVSGIIDKLYVDFNDEVKAGQVIAEMDKVTLEAEYQSSQAQLSSAKTEYDYQTKEYNRIKTLHDKELVSDSEYDQALYEYEKASNAYKEAQASMVKVRRNLGYATITSPIDGVVINRAVEEGQTVAAGFETPTLFTIANDLTKMQVIADVDEADIGQVSEGQRCEFGVDAYPDETFEGQVSQVRLEATTESSVVTYEVVITAENPDLKLKPGLTANVTIYTLEKTGVLAVPTKALKFTPEASLLSKVGISVDTAMPAEEEGSHVWVLSGSQLKYRLVTTGEESEDMMTEVTDGLSEGEVVAIGLAVSETGKKEEDTSSKSPFMPGGPK